MRPLDLREFAEDMRRKGDIRESDLADEILTLVDLEEEVAEPYSQLSYDLENMYAAEFSQRDDPAKALEWVGDRSLLLAEIEKVLDEDGRTGDTDDQVKAMLEVLTNIRAMVGLDDKATDEDIENAVQALVDRAPPEMEYDL